MSDVAARLGSALADRYRIERQLGQGGMATVYLAEDLKHKRRVALKVLKPELAAVLGAERFVQEITTTAALQHPNILPLFDSGEADGFLYYVMPFIDGETLREKLSRETQFGVEEAVRIATDVADALQYAHEQGVIHRDIKPENILLAKGRPMVADFGIALALSAAAGGRMTETGLSLGTPHYMSPEQATADKDISARSDIYSLASVLYEMLAGEPPHMGNSAQQIIMKIIAEPVAPVTVLRKSVPPNVAAALAKALEKLPADRFMSAKAFAEALANAAFTTPRMSGAAVASGGARWKERAAIPLAAMSALLLGALAWQWSQRPPPPMVAHHDLVLGDARPLVASDVAISPDGRYLAYVGAVGAEPQAVYLRRLDGEAEFRRMVGSEGANATPTFSPDSRSIAFRRAGDGALIRMPVAGGATEIITRIGTEIGAFLHWGTAETIIYSGGPAGLFKVAAAGGSPELIPKTERAARYSFLLSDGSGILFSRSDIVKVLDFARDTVTDLVPNATHPVLASNGQLLYFSDGGLYAAPFDVGSKRLSGDPVRVVESVAAALGRRGFSVSRGGTIVYREGASELSSATAMATNRLVMGDIATRTVRSIDVPAAGRAAPRFSPDGRSLVFAVASNRDAEWDIAVLELATGTITRLTFSGNNRFPIWSPDATQILFAKDGDEIGERTTDLFVKPVDNSTPERPFLTLDGSEQPNVWLGDGTVLFMKRGARVTWDILRQTDGSNAAPTPFRAGPSSESDVAISPDGRLAAYASTESNSNGDIWLTDYPAGQGKWQVSTTNGQSARWSRDGRYVYYWKGIAATGDSLFRVRIDRTPSVVVRAPEFVVELSLTAIRNWDLHPDGKRFVAILREVSPASGAGTRSRYLVVQNWFVELEARRRAARE